MLNSYNGKILVIDMTTGHIEKQDLNEDYAREYIGGRGLGARYLYDLLEPAVDPLSPDNVIIAMTGPFTGTGIYACQKYEWTSKSPLTGIYLCSNSGGRLGDRLKRLGYDGLIIKGASDEPKYLIIDGDNVELRDASFVWGKMVSEAQNTLRHVTGANAVVCTGSAADLPDPVKFSGVYDGSRCAGRGGLGAVFGSKKLKAIAVMNPPKENSFQVKDANNLKELMNELLKDMKENPVTGDQLPRAGSIIWLDTSAGFGIFPAKNHQEIRTMEDVEGKLDAETYEKYVEKGRESAFANCISCPIKSGHVVIPKRGRWAGESSKGPEFESAWSLGTNVGSMEYEHILAANKACNEYGIDTISTGSAMAFAMECNQRGLLDKNKLDGLQLAWGNSENILKLIDKIGNREGWLGNLLADGVRNASKEIGGNSSDFALHVKGLELPAYDPRGVWGMALTYATACRGACHLKLWTVGAEFKDYDPISTQGKAELVKDIQDLRAVLDSLIVCIFAGRAITKEWVVRLVNATTDHEWTEDDIAEFGARIYNLERALITREGITSKDDMLPNRILEDALTGGRSKGVKIGKDNFLKMLNEYYKARGWDKDGIPYEESIKT
ncbi:aldehyde ferredoxin oxidoreductase [Candidatus Poribacteria bacterium]|nr:aldehyde ferredoxin oxidoreductase [Candidatus Poribacteria bacterium]